MKLAYYPGCTMITKAANLEIAAVEALNVLGVEFTELERWNCCGAVFSLAEDDLIHHVASVRNLVRAQEQGAEQTDYHIIYFTTYLEMIDAGKASNHFVISNAGMPGTPRAIAK